ncbi:MAG TPA: hypothetical protein VLE97_01230 [Gaiellaceae bacterium]|nr:hypothetical protein [Gaiellaceae bacterium]
MSTALGLALALGSAGALNWGYVAQHGGAASLPPLALRRPLQSLRALFSQRQWVAGFLAGFGGWVLYVAALRLAPLSLVQAVSAGGIGLLALLAGRPLAITERRGVIVALAGMALLSVSLAGGSNAGSQPPWPRVAVWMALSAAAAGLAVVLRRPRLAAGAGLGIAAGILFAAGDVGTKAAVGGGGRLAFVPALLACHAVAFSALQLGFQRGSVLATAGVASLLTNAVPIAAGVVVFHEHLPGGALGVARGAAFAAVVAGAALLAVSLRRPVPNAIL